MLTINSLQRNCAQMPLFIPQCFVLPLPRMHINCLQMSLRLECVLLVAAPVILSDHGWCCWWHVNCTSCDFNGSSHLVLSAPLDCFNQLTLLFIIQHAVAKAHITTLTDCTLYMCGSNITAMSFKIFSHLWFAFLLTKYSKLHPAYSSASPGFDLPWLLASQPYCSSPVCHLFITQPSPKLTLPLLTDNKLPLIRPQSVLFFWV